MPKRNQGEDEPDIVSEEEDDNLYPEKPVEFAQRVVNAPAATEDELAEDALAVYNSNALGVGSPGSFMFDANPVFELTEIKIPRLRLIQGISPEVASREAAPGQWMLTGNDPLDEVTVIPLGMMRNRELRGVGDDRNTIHCSSIDAITGVGVPGGDCKSCPMSQWVNNPGGGKNFPPKCTLVYAYMVYIAEFDVGAMVRFSKTAMPAADYLNGLCQKNKGFGKWGVKMSSLLVKSTGNNAAYYVPSPVRDMNIEPAQLARAAEFAMN